MCRLMTTIYKFVQEQEEKGWSGPDKEMSQQIAKLTEWVF